MVSYRHKFRFYLDENFPVPAGKFLRTLGHTVFEGLKILKKPGLSDSRHLNEAIKQSAILLSYDRDFWIDPKHRRRIAKSHGVILISPSPRGRFSFDLGIRLFFRSYLDRLQMTTI
ncbi:MAG TPA: DUF5615 family PIN-like protein [Patescibacteria group bacterium]|nr:DUF5615 family PIN-like protein [Patescibacteria group bacterium]